MDKVKVTGIKMPRPCKRRRIRGRPASDYFKPAGIQLRDLEDVELSLAEFEAIRLVDLNQTPQSQAAEDMNISQPTLSRILSTGRNKVADALINGKAIRIKPDN